MKLNEEEILKFWKNKKILTKSRKKNEKGKNFYFMDGPPYATGHIHMGTALNKVLKDIIIRSQRFQGKNIFDRAGYDTHGVPIEFQVEKEIGSKSKKDIEKFGVEKFIEKCKKFATQYIGVMNSEFENLGVWMDFKDPYLTLNPKYIEKIWETFKYADEKGLLYLGKYPIHICPRCETAVAFNEIIYTKLEDNSIFVKFPLKNKKNTYLIIWTTTPWTLPGNTGIMVNPNFDYQEIEISNGERWIMAKELVPKLMAELEMGCTAKRIYKGKEMKGWEYNSPLEKNINVRLKKPRKVVLSSRYVNLEEGTGLVHTAPGHGKEDYEVGKETGLESISPVAINGLLTEEAGKYKGKKARIVDEEIIKDLEKDGALIFKKKYSHDYPLCWRCKEPLLMVSLPQWFLKISKIHSKLLEENEKTNWIPGYMKLRMKAWLEGISDWPVSRERYWGTPLPIWVCNKCGEKIVIGSIKELEKLSGKKVKEVHKPEIDQIKIGCKKCKGMMNRVNGVLDVWFDSGVSSWAALETDANIKKFWPANLNIEGKDQFRGWWNSQLILSMIRFDKKPFENIVVHGMVLDIGKRKMSKSLGNIVSPQEVIKKYSRDYLRYYFAKISKGEDFAFDESEFKEIQKVFRVLTNLENFICQIELKKAEIQIEDKWILSRFNSIVDEATGMYNQFELPEAVQLLENFLINDLSRTYVQMIRDRSDEVKRILEEIYLGILKLLAPIIPFVTESIWQSLKENKIVKEESIHLTEFPKPDKKKIDKKIEKEMETALQVIEKGLAERDKAQIGLKWPLAKATVTLTESIDAANYFKELIAKQLNVKKIEVKLGSEFSVDLDTRITPELEAEGYARNMIRNIQEFRKKLGLKPENKVKITIICSEKLKNMLKKHKNIVADKTNSKELEIELTSKETFKNKTRFKIKNEEGEVGIIV